MKETHILIIDDNKSILSALKMLLRPLVKTIELFTSPDQAYNEFKRKKYDAVLLDMNFRAGVNSGNEGLYWLDKFIQCDSSVSVIMMTAYGDVDLAVKAIKKGAVDFVLKPWENEKLLATLQSATNLTISRREVLKLRGKEKNLVNEINKSSKHIIGKSMAIESVLKLVSKVAGTDANVLITGENGTGKELVAREIHRLSKRKDNLLVTVDMGAIPETLFESEIFGHKKGAFTDAREDRTGKFELASGGTIFMDEIGNLSSAMQAKLLNVLQNRTLTPVGSNHLREIDIRLVSATNCDLINMVSSGAFREDLLYRLNTITIHVPPLRERKGDVEILSNFFLGKFSARYNKGALKISKEAMEQLISYPWPGNVRELQHTIEKAVILAESTTLTPGDFYLRTSATKHITSAITLDEMEKDLITNAVERNRGNMTAAAEELGVTRQTLYNKMKKYEI